MRNVRDMRGAEKENPDFCLGLASRPASRRTQQKLGSSPNPLLFWETPERNEAMKNRRITLRVSDADWQKLHDKATASRMTLTDYLTACGLQKEIVIIDGLEEVIRQQKGVGRNLNQLTTLANMRKVKTVYLQELTGAYAQVSSLLSEILKRKRWT